MATASGGDHAAAAQLVLHDDRLTERFRQIVRDRAAEKVHDAAGRERDHQRDRPRRPILGRRRTRGGAQHGRDGDENEHLAKRSLGMTGHARIAHPPPILTFLAGILVQVAGARNAGVAGPSGFFVAGYRPLEPVEFRTACPAPRCQPGSRRRAAPRP